MKKYFLAFGLSLLLAMPVLAITLDSITEQITIDLGKQEKAYAEISGGKFLTIDPIKVSDGYYRVDEYETPCKDGYMPPTCYGYQIVFVKNDKTMWSTGEGLKAKDLSDKAILESYDASKEEKVTSTPKL